MAAPSVDGDPSHDQRARAASSVVVATARPSSAVPTWAIVAIGAAVLLAAVIGWRFWSSATQRDASSSQAPAVVQQPQDGAAGQPDAASALPAGIDGTAGTEATGTTDEAAASGAPRPDRSDAPGEAGAAAEATAQDAADAPAGSVPESAPAPPAVDPAALARAREAREREALERRQRQEQERQRAAELERQRAETLARQEAEVARQRAAQEQARRDAEAAAQAARVPAATDAVRSVETRCADSSNPISREFCYARQCRKRELASDPICVRFRELEETRRRQELQGN